MTVQKKVQSFTADIKAVDGEAGIFEGYGSVFGVVDSYNEVVDAGAFVESLSKYGMPKLLLQHSSRMVGGVYLEAREDARGLYLKGQLNLEVQDARETYALLKQGALSGLSIGFIPEITEDNRTTGIRHLKKVRLMEVSIVTFPANEEATITAVKSAPENIRDFEKFLREAGYSQEDAKFIASKGYRALEIHREGGDLALALTALEGAMNQLRKSLPDGGHPKAHPAG